VTDVRLTRSIEAIEDALGNEVYYFFSKTDQKQIDRPMDFDEERMLILFLKKILNDLFSFRHSPREIVMNKIKTLENHVRTMQNQVINFLIDFFI
jgi:hypothetical protein